jgi:phage terminase Nu1 subunit (DNA packaging protein)
MTKRNQPELSDTAIDACAVVRLVMATCGASDEGLIRAALGNASVTSITAVAGAFGVAESTVRNTWRRDPSMPGTAKRGTGQRSRYVLADICLWALKRAAAARNGRAAQNNAHQRTDVAREELNAIELESARLGLEIRRAKHGEVYGDLVSASIARSEWSCALTVLRDGILEIPRHVKPMLPAKVADQTVAEIDRVIRHKLTQICETGCDKVAERLRHQNGQPHD